MAGLHQIQGDNPVERSNTITAQVMPQQEKMLNAFKDGDYEHLIDAIFSAERQTAIDVDSSRILNGREDWRADATFLLAQLDPKVLRSVLDNTYPQRAKTELRNSLRSPYTSNEGYDPVIYINYCADHTGKGLPVDEAEKFLATLETAVGLSSESADFQELQRREIREEMDRVYLRLVPSLRERRDEFSDLVNESKPILRNNVLEFVRNHRETVIPRAHASESKYIAIHGEVGLASKGYERCRQHKSLDKGSPIFFRLVQVILNVVFPRRGFSLHQFILFDCVRASQVEIGESIASVLCSSYVTVGGVNTAQAAISLGDIPRIPEGIWQEVCNAVKLRGCFQRIEANLKRFDAQITTQLKREQDTLAEIRRKSNLREEFHRNLEPTRKHLEDQLILEVQKLELKLAAADRRKQELFDAIKRENEDREVISNNEKHLRELLEELIDIQASDSE